MMFFKRRRFWKAVEKLNEAAKEGKDCDSPVQLGLETFLGTVPYVMNTSVRITSSVVKKVEIMVKAIEHLRKIDIQNLEDSYDYFEKEGMSQELKSVQKAIDSREHLLGNIAEILEEWNSFLLKESRRSTIQLNYMIKKNCRCHG